MPCSTTTPAGSAPAAEPDHEARSQDEVRPSASETGSGADLEREPVRDVAVDPEDDLVWLRVTGGGARFDAPAPARFEVAPIADRERREAPVPVSDLAVPLRVERDHSVSERPREHASCDERVRLVPMTGDLVLG